MKLLLLLCFISCHSLLSLPMPMSSSPCHFPAIFNFGDSNSDTGGLTAAFGPLPPPYGETYFKTPVGRYSDGRLLIDFIASSLRLPLLSAYLDSMGTNFSHGANFATSASPIVAQNISLAQGGYSPFSLDVQLAQFSRLKSRSELIYKQGGVFKDLVPMEEYFSRALYTIDIGQNDLTAGYFLNKSTDEYIPAAMEVFSTAVKSIYEKGGRYFWIHNTGPLGCLPYAFLRRNLKPEQFDSVGCGTPYNELAQHFNMMLSETVVQLRKELPLAALTYVDVYSAKYLLISQAEKFGFENPIKVCCGHGGGEYNFDFAVTCFDEVVLNGTEVSLASSCKSPLKSVNWDGYHYTEAANRWVFGQISRGAFSDPPNPLKMACRRAYQ